MRMHKVFEPTHGFNGFPEKNEKLYMSFLWYDE